MSEQEEKYVLLFSLVWKCFHFEPLSKFQAEGPDAGGDGFNLLVIVDNEDAIKPTLYDLVPFYMALQDDLQLFYDAAVSMFSKNGRLTEADRRRYRVPEMHPSSVKKLTSSPHVPEYITW